jgi:nucleoside-diphosphate-sugar epimerase
MTTIVTGGTGFIGAYVVRDLVAAGERVVCLDIDPADGLLTAIGGPATAHAATIVRGDVAEWTRVVRVLREHGVDRIIHLASLLNARSEEDFAAALRVNCQGTHNILEAAVALGIRKVVLASSVAVFGLRSKSADGTVYNDAVHDPDTVYGICKSFNERMADHYSATFGLDTLSLRFTLTYGYGKHETLKRGTAASYLEALIDRPTLIGGKSTVLYGDDEADWLYIDDASRAVICAWSAPAGVTGAYIVRGKQHGMREVFEIVRGLLPNVEMVLEPGRRRELWKFDGALTYEALGYEAHVDVHEGVPRTMALLREHAGMPALG